MNRESKLTLARTSHQLAGTIGLAGLLSIVIIASFAAAWLTRPLAPPYRWSLPPGLPTPPVPDTNPMSPAKVELGRWLFYDKRLSVNATIACESCHQQALAFTDGRAQALGATDEPTPRGAMSLVNVAYNQTFDWAHPHVVTLEQQMLTPLFGEEPIEMGLTGHQERVLSTLAGDPNYRTLFRQAYPRAEVLFTWPHVVYAIASFVRSIVSAASRYDAYIAGDTGALSDAEIRGFELFVGERLECFHCHGGFNFTDSSTHDLVRDPPQQFHNTGLYNIDDDGRYPTPNTGVHASSGRAADMGRFKAPSLRNITLTAPYMHDGSVTTLDLAIDHYARGGRRIETGRWAGDGARNPNKSEFVSGFELSTAERADLLAFLNSLTDYAVTRDPRWSDPLRHGAAND